MQERSIPLLGENTIEALGKTHIAVFGIGGVGGFVVEALARQGIKEFSLIDFDTVSESNFNRQIIATDSSLGKLKVEVMKNRILDINKNAIVHCYPIKVDLETIEDIDFNQIRYVVDCIDDIPGKIAIIATSKKLAIPVITCCGTGNKLNPMKFQIKDISKTTVCPLAKKLRLELRKLNINDVPALFSTEEPIARVDFIPSVSFVPSVAGLLIARHVILEIQNKVIKNRIHLVLEGGGMKGVYTSGVLDFFLEKNIKFDAIYGVSAGACAATSYLSNQPGRSYHAMVDYIGNPNYASKRSLTRTGNYFNKKFVYETLPKKLLPFDYDKANSNKCRLYATVTNVETGRAEYHECKDFHFDTEYVCASASLPLLAEIQTIDGKGYLDGGLADPIPYVESKKNALKSVVVLTKPEEYVCQKQNSILLQAMKLLFHKYPKLLKTIENRHLVYNQTLSQMKADKNVFLIRPSKNMEIDRLEQNKQKLEDLYNLGYSDAEKQYEDLLEFINR